MKMDGERRRLRLEGEDRNRAEQVSLPNEAQRGALAGASKPEREIENPEHPCANYRAWFLVREDEAFGFEFRHDRIKRLLGRLV
jgi:hypothetical protein